MREVSVYLAGNIQKGHEKESAVFWTSAEASILQEKAGLCKIVFLNPATRTDDLSDQKSVFGRDMTQVFLADVVLVDVRERRGLGVGAEMMWAKANQRYIISLCPKNSHYHKATCHLLGQTVENWTHPFVESLSDVVVETIEEMGEALAYFVAHQPKSKDLNFVNDCMAYYQEHQLPLDLPMKSLTEQHTSLNERLIGVRPQSH